jgi:hypothetical protein
LSRRHGLVALLVAGAIGVGSSAGAGSAASPTVVPVYFCAFSKGPVTVPAGSPIVLRYGWAATTRAYTQDFVNSSSITLTVAGNRIPGTRSYWSTPFELEDGIWRADWIYPTGITLAKKETVEITFDNVLRWSVQDGFDPNPIPAGSLDGMLGCTISGK